MERERHVECIRWDRKHLQQQGCDYLSTAWVEAWCPDGLKIRYAAREFMWLKKPCDLFTAASICTTEGMLGCIAIKKKLKRRVRIAMCRSTISCSSRHLKSG